MATPQQIEESKRLLAQGDILGQQASQVTGISYTPVSTPVSAPAPVPVSAPIPTAITGADLADQPLLDLPSQTQEPDYKALIGSLSIEQLFPTEPTKTEKTQDELSNRLLELSGKLTGKTATIQQIEQQTGIPGFQTQLRDVTNQLQALQKEALAIPLAIENEFLGRGATRGGVAPIQASRLRENAIKALGLSAIASSIQGNLMTAEAQVQRAIQLEFLPVQSEIEYLTLVLGINRERLSREDQKRADAQKIVLQERQRILNEQKSEREEIYKLGLSAAQAGADSKTLQLISNARNREEALHIAGFYLGENFRRKIGQEQFERDLQKATFELSFEKFMEDARQFDIRTAQDKFQFETSLNEQQKKFDLQYALDQQKFAYDKFRDLQKKDPVLAAESTSIIFQNKINLIDDLTKHAGLNKAVGPSFLGRITPFKIDVLSGQVQDFIAGVTQLVNKETIDTLVNLKARGGTLGALSDQERLLLQSAATKIGSWQIIKDGKVVGYNISEKAFKSELETIRNLAITAQARALGGGIVDTSQTNQMDELRAAGYSEEQIRLLMEL